MVNYVHWATRKDTLLLLLLLVNQVHYNRTSSGFFRFQETNFATLVEEIVCDFKREKFFTTGRVR